MSIKYQPVLPSSLLEQRTEMDMNFKKQISENMYLRLGTVLEVIDVGDEKNQSGFMPEYNVMALQNDNTSVYKNVIAIDSFGGIADYFQRKFRVPKDVKKVKNSGSLKKQEGSIVLMLCIDGASEQAVILGGAPNPNRPTILTKEKGHHLEGEFNGINWQIDKDGALTILFKSSTDSAGKPSNEEAGGSFIKIESDGSITLNDGNEESIRIDKTGKKITVNAESDISVTTKANVNITAEKNLNAKATADLVAEAEGSATLKSGGKMGIEAGGPLNLKCPNADLLIDGMMKVKASQIMISAPQIMVGDGGSPAVILTTQVLAIGNLGAPTIGTFIGPFSSSVFIGS